MVKQAMLELSEHGRPLKNKVGEAHAKLILRVVDRLEFTDLYMKRYSNIELANKFDVAASNIPFLIEYWELPERQKPQPTKSIKAIDVDALAERIWMNLEERITKKVNDAVTEALK